MCTNNDPGIQIKAENAGNLVSNLLETDMMVHVLTLLSLLDMDITVTLELQHLMLQMPCSSVLIHIC